MIHQINDVHGSGVRLLEYFLVVAEKGNVTRAAEALHITQPTLSRQLIELERELGTQLLIRSNREVRLTDSRSCQPVYRQSGPT